MTWLDRWHWGPVLFTVQLAVTVGFGCGTSPSNHGGLGSNPNGSGSGGGGPGSTSDDGGSGTSGNGSSGNGSPGNGSSGGGSSGGSSGGGTMAAQADAGAGTASGDGGFCLLAGGGDYTQPGPYAVTTLAGIDLSSTGDLPPDAGPTTATATYPTNLDDDCLHPIVSWANGTGVDGGAAYQFFQTSAASWGIVVMAADNPESAGPGFAGDGPYNRAGIDYLLKANDDPSSPFFHHLSARAGVSGHSQGAYAATEATVHPNVQAEVQVEGGGTPKAGIAFLALTGSDDTVVTPTPPLDSYDSATGPSMYAEYSGADHTTTPTALGYFEQQPGTIQFMRFYTAWWRCFLGDDPVACKMFKGGSDCGVCKDPNWTMLLTKNM
jgi:hypothetical protein